MKNFFFILLIGFLFSCNDGTKPPAFDAHGGRDHSEEAAQPTAKSEELALNNGAKWKSDDATNANVAELKKIANDFKTNPNPSSEDYQALNGNMGRGLNKMIQECKMEGPDHDALHIWLEPVLRENAQLKELTSASESKRVFDSLDNRLTIYNNYFE